MTTLSHHHYHHHQLMDSQQRHHDPCLGVCESACGHRHNTQSSSASTTRHHRRHRGGDGVDACPPSCPGRDPYRRGPGPSHGLGRGPGRPDHAPHGSVSRPPLHRVGLGGASGGRVAGPLPRRRRLSHIPCVSFL